MITRIEDLVGVRREAGHIAGTWTDLVGEGTVGIGVRRIEVDPGRWSTPLHMECSEEEIFYVLGGDGVSLQWDGQTTVAVDVRAGDVLVHLAGRHGHTLRAGPGGLDVLAFGERHLPWGSTLLPRAGVSWGLGAWARTGDPDDHPWRRETLAGEPEVPPRTAQGDWPWIVSVDDVEPDVRVGATVTRHRRDLGRAAGSARTGLKLYEPAPGALSVPPHCHSAEEELFVVLGGEGALELWRDARIEEIPVRSGTTVARPAGTGVSHTFRGGDDPLRLLAYGTRRPDDITFYPRSRKVYFRGLGVITRVGEPADYWDGED